MAKPITGVDIGTDTIKLVTCENGMVKSVVVERMPEGMVSSGHNFSPDAVADFIAQLRQDNGGIAKDVALVLDGSESFIRCLSMPMMTAKELMINLPYEFRDFIPTGRENYYYDYAVLDTAASETGEQQVELLAAAASMEAIKEYTLLFERAGMKLLTAMPEAAAYQNIVGSRAPGQDCAIIDFAHTSTDIHFFNKGKYDLCRSIEIGGLDEEHLIASEYTVDDHTAVTYKLKNFDGCLESQPMMDLYDRVAVEVSRAMSFYSYNNPDTDIQRVYYTGGNAANINLLRAVEKAAGILLEPMSALVGGTERDTRTAFVAAAAIGATMGVN